MAWPPAYSSAFIGTGVTTIKWGTDGIMSNAAPNGNSSGGFLGFYTVESARPNDEIENIYIEQGSGLKATRIQLWQGRRVSMTVIDDTNMTFWAPNTQCSITDPLSASILVFKVVENGSNAVRKQEHRRDITVEYLTCIEGAGTPPPA